MKYKLVIICVFLCRYALFNDCQAQAAREASTLQVTPEVTRMLIDSISEYLDRYYVFPDTAKKMSAYVNDQFKEGVYQRITDPEELAGRLERDLQKAHRDIHLRLHYAPGGARDFFDTTGKAARDRRNDSIEEAHNFGFEKVELLPGNIGYVVLHGFSSDPAGAMPVVAAAFRFVSHSRAVIIDLRRNGEGIPPMVGIIESYFFPSKTHTMDVISRLEGKTFEFWTDPENTKGLILRMPVYILTSRHTYSAAEAFSYSMQSLKRAVVVGDTTGGAAHITKDFPVGQGFILDIPHTRSVNVYTHTDWEGKGVIPDIAVAPDNALQAAEEAIFADAVRNAPTDREKRSLQWILDDLHARQSVRWPDSASLARYAGTYRGGLVFYVNAAGLFCRNAERGNEVFRLIPVSGDKFILDENVHVEFRKDEKGNFSGIDMLWSNGSVSSKPREE